MNRTARRIAIRADGGGQIGLGHVMRCAALAQAIHAKSIAVDWITATPAILPAPLARIATVHNIATASDETAAIADVLARTGASLLVGDWKITDAARVAELRRRGWPVVLIGGWLGEAKGDLHVRQDLAAATGSRDPHTLGGPDWLLLGEPYRSAPARIVRDEATRLLVSLGGTDTPLLANVRDLLESDTRFARWQPEFCTPAGTCDAGTVQPLHQALAAADIGILAGGTTLHEAAALGLPVLCVPIAGNQYRRADQLQKAGLGIVIDPQARCFERRLADALAALAADPARRARMARRGQALVDGRGAERLADLLADRFLTTAGESQ